VNLLGVHDPIPSLSAPIVRPLKPITFIYLFHIAIWGGGYIVYPHVFYSIRQVFLDGFVVFDNNHKRRLFNSVPCWFTDFPPNRDLSRIFLYCTQYLWLQFFFHELSSPKPLKITLGLVQIFSKMGGDIRKSRCTTGFNYTCGKFSIGINDTSGKFSTGTKDTAVNWPSVLLVSLKAVANNGNNTRLHAP
jgi:hypothetical protein